MRENKEGIFSDIGIIGGGPAGLVAALALVRRGFSVSVFEKSNYDNVRLGEHLSPLGVSVLQKLEILRALETRSCIRSNGVTSLWGEDSPRFKSYFFNPHGYGLCLDRHQFDSTLAKIVEASGVRLSRQTVLKQVRRGSRDWQLTFDRAGETLSHRTSFLIDASGRRCSLATKLGAKRTAFDNQIAIARYFHQGKESLSGTHEQSGANLLVEAVSDGWWYSASLPGRRHIASFITDSDLRKQDTPLECWQSAFSNATFTTSHIADQIVEGNVIVRSARSQILEPAVGRNGWIAIGDAAASYDPLSSAGLSKALECALSVVPIIEEALASKMGALQKYADSVRAEFDSYLATKRAYYQLEKRWSFDPYWLRRHWPNAEKMPVFLSPNSLVVLADQSVARTRRNPAGQRYGVDLEKIAGLARRPIPAHALLFAYMSTVRDTQPDISLISALQMLVRDNSLRLVA